MFRKMYRYMPKLEHSNFEERAEKSTSASSNTNREDVSRLIKTASLYSAPASGFYFF